ncbi:AraC family transcriptional regulator [Aquincola sp. S2]|uniref:AraC family transcriptional regulator n=1 Tax=Pseudaquabacterium terrae TaxID=2732868 RepID=A0ABX2EC44_9BURK|nr:AraC family transcriptional regulator [Aquabacterium terrae]NRF65937.1 AraC family transcriptional regulator [Aquabacterium terrae]
MGFERRIYWPHSIAAIVAELAGQGIDAAAALEGTGLAASQLGAPTTRTSYRQLDTVVRNALRLSSDPATALRAGLRMHVTAYWMYGYALLSSATRADAARFVARYVRIVGPFCDVTFSNQGAKAWVALAPMHWPGASDAVHRFALEFALAAHLVAHRDGMGPAFRFSRIAVDHPAPAHADVYEALFGCPVSFDQAGAGYERAFDDGPLGLADPRTHAMAREVCDQLLAEVDRAGRVAADVWPILLERRTGPVSIDDVAAQLAMSPRALRRRLEAEGTTYRHLLAEARKRLAIEYLSTTRLTHEEIAQRVGYSDAANFRHAFLRWTGRNPSDVRGGTRM